MATKPPTSHDIWADFAAETPTKKGPFVSTRSLMTSMHVLRQWRIRCLTSRRPTAIARARSIYSEVDLYPKVRSKVRPVWMGRSIGQWHENADSMALKFWGSWFSGCTWQPHTHTVLILPFIFVHLVHQDSSPPLDKDVLDHVIILSCDYTQRSLSCLGSSQDYMERWTAGKIIVNYWLVVFRHPSEKYESIGMMTFPILMGK